jgi:hypothetical protein
MTTITTNRLRKKAASVDQKINHRPSQPWLPAQLTPASQPLEALMKIFTEDYHQPARFISITMTKESMNRNSLVDL